MEELHHPIYGSQESHVICTLIGHESSCYYLCNVIIPETFNRYKHRNLIRNASHHSLISSDLYRRGLNGTLLRFLEKEEFDQVLVNIHVGICGGHSNGLSMAQRLLRVGYYWPMMQIDVVAFVKSVKNMVTRYMIQVGSSFLLFLIIHYSIGPLILLGRFIPTHHVDTGLLSLLLITSLNG